MTRPLAWRLKNISVYIGVLGYLAMIITQDVKVGALSKLLAESLRIAYYRKTDAHDMARLSVFFIVASTIALIK
jgi:hypothetical protein